jgi:hypothetical protein
MHACATGDFYAWTDEKIVLLMRRHLAAQIEGEGRNQGTQSPVVLDDFFPVERARSMTDAHSLKS